MNNHYTMSQWSVRDISASRRINMAGFSLTAIEILRLLRDMPRLTPILIGKKMKRPPSVIRNVMVTLVELGLVSSAARGLYELTQSGIDVLERTELYSKRSRVLDLEDSLAS
jgi:DNA-binding IclR family transcriptional regulator